jgi:hypothetical protein
VTATHWSPAGDSRDDRAFVTTQRPATLTGSNPWDRGDSVPWAGKQPGPGGMTHSAPDSFYELVAR